MEGPAAALLVADVFRLSSATGKYLTTKSVTNTLLPVLKLSLHRIRLNVLGRTTASRREDSPTFLGLTPSSSSGYC